MSEDFVFVSSSIILLTICDMFLLNMLSLLILTAKLCNAQPASRAQRLLR